jgi:hypothetical protein
MLLSTPLNQESDNEINKLLSLESVDWTPVVLDGTPWNDPSAGIGSRVANDVWNSLAASILRQSTTNNVAAPHDSRILNSSSSDASKTSILEGQRREQMRGDILRSLGIAKLAPVVRSHFFGRDRHSWKQEERVSTQVVLGRRVSRKQSTVNEKPYQSVPSRIHASINFFWYLGPDEIASSRDLVVEMLPICFELIDSLTPVLVAQRGQVD